MKTVETAKEKLRRIWRDAWRPPDRRPPWAWCEDHITSIPYSPVPGRFRSDNSPWMREPMEALVDPRIRLVSIIAAIQSGKTSVGELGVAYIIANLPGPTLWLDQTDDDAKDQSESRLQKLFDECPPVRALYPANRHKRRLSTVHFANGMTLWVLGAHNKTNLQRRSIRWLIGDETWRWPTGHMAEAEARVTAFGWLGKCLFMSQGGEEDDDTHRKYETTDMRVWTFECPHCHQRQPFKWEQVEWRPVWEVPDDIDEEYLAQMESEQRIKKGGKWIWERIGSRPNHLFDCEAMQVAAAFMLKLVGQEAGDDASVDTPDEAT